MIENYFIRALERCPLCREFVYRKIRCSEEAYTGLPAFEDEVYSIKLKLFCIGKIFWINDNVLKCICANFRIKSISTCMHSQLLRINYFQIDCWNIELLTVIIYWTLLFLLHIVNPISENVKRIRVRTIPGFMKNWRG